MSERHDPNSFLNHLRGQGRYVRAWAWLIAKFMLVGVVALVVMFSLFFVAMGAIGLTSSDNAFGWLFGGWLLVYIGLMWQYGNYLKDGLQRRW